MYNTLILSYLIRSDLLEIYGTSRTQIQHKKHWNIFCYMLITLNHCIINQKILQYEKFPQCDHPYFVERRSFDRHGTEKRGSQWTISEFPQWRF